MDWPAAACCCGGALCCGAECVPALTLLVARTFEFMPPVRALVLAATAVEFLAAGEKKCCELAGAFRTEEAPGALLVGLKLSREGVTGILPVTRLACLKEAWLILP